MLNNNNHNSSCEFSAEIVSYLYNESSVAARNKFETHLANCGVCTDEFATISNARFSVFEWQKDEFAHLLTPEIVIPYARKRPEPETVATVGFLSGFRGLLSVLSSPSTVSVAAALAVCLGLGFLALTYFGRGDQQIAANVNVPPVESPDDPARFVLPEGPKTPVTSASKNGVPGQEVRLVKGAALNGDSHRDKRATAGTQRLVNNVAVRNSTHPVRKAPVLNNFDDDDDKSLRLSDLFDEVGAKR